LYYNGNKLVIAGSNPAPATKYKKMKLEIDTEAKTIAFDKPYTFDDITSVLSTLFSNGEWLEYKLIEKQFTMNLSFIDKLNQEADINKNKPFNKFYY
jgi:hypothetical protein